MSRAALAALLTAACLLCIGPLAHAAPSDQAAQTLVREIMRVDYARGRYRAALGSLRTALTLCDDGACSKKVHAQIHIAIGTVLAHGLKRRKAALASFDEALSLNPRAQLLKGQRPRLAKSAFKKAKEKRSGNGQAKKPTKRQPPKRIAVYIDGLSAAHTQRDVISAIPAAIKVVPIRGYRLALARAGMRSGVARQMGAPGGRPKLLRAVRKANKRMRVDAALVGRIKNGKLQILYIDDAGVALDQTLDQDADELFAALTPILTGRATKPKPPKPPPPDAPPDEAEPTPEDEEPEGEEGEEDEEPEDDDASPDSPYEAHDFSRALLIARANFALRGRFFGYVESANNSPNLRDYDVFPAPAFGVSAEIYPAAMSDIAFVKDLGLTLAFGSAPSIPSETTEGQAFGSSIFQFEVGMRGRIRTGEGPLPTLGLNASFGFLSQSFSAENDAANAIIGELAEVSYKWLRAGIDLRSQIDRFAITVRGGYLGVLAGGAVFERFRDPSVVGFDVGAGFGVRLLPGLEATLNLDYQRIIYRFNPEPGDLFAAAGATDQQLTPTLGLGFAY